MAIAMTLRQYLDVHDVEYEVLKHAQTASSTRTAQATHVPGHRLAKGVVLKQGGEYLLAVLPASRHVELVSMESWLNRPVTLATEDEVGSLFPDCDIGAVPAIASAYGLDAVVDSSLDEQDDIYFEGGDHRTVVHITGEQFRKLTGSTPRRQIGGPV